MAGKQLCIPNLFCVNYSFIIIVLLVVLLYVTLVQRKTKEIIKKVYVDSAKKVISRHPQDDQPGLYRKMYDKLEEPTRIYPGTPINIRTQGALPSFQNVGYIYREESDPSYNPDDVNRFALFGRPDYAGADKWEYYISGSDNIKIKLSNTKEIYSDDTVSLTGFAGDWLVHINDFAEFKYIPYIF